MVLVDATVWIDFLRGITTPQSRWLRANLGSVPFGLTDLTLCEVLQGIDNPDEARRVEALFLALPVLSTGGLDLARETATNYRSLRKKGLTVRKTIDCWIATYCLREGHSLLHSDRDFLPFEEHFGLGVPDFAPAA